MYIRTRGLVLRETNYKEADKILTVLTDEGGRRTVKARGCRRKGSRIAACAQLLAFSEMTLFEHRDHYTMNEAASLDLFPRIRSDIERLALASCFAELAETVAEEGRADTGLFSLVLNCLYALDKLDKPTAQVKAAFELRLMCLAGYQPTLEGCAVCGADEPEEPRLLLHDGLLCCAACRAGAPGGVRPVSRGALRAMRHIAWCEGKRLLAFSLDPDGLCELAGLCEEYLTTQLERGFRTLDFYRSLIGGGIR